MAVLQYTCLLAWTRHGILMTVQDLWQVYWLRKIMRPTSSEVPGVGGEQLTVAADSRTMQRAAKLIFRGRSVGCIPLIHTNMTTICHARTHCVSCDWSHCSRRNRIKSPDYPAVQPISLSKMRVQLQSDISRMFLHARWLVDELMKYSREPCNGFLLCSTSAYWLTS